jgi:sulfur carrier protein ThiS
MLITFKLYASLTEFLPVDRRNGNSMPLDVPTGATVAEVVARFALPMKLVHLVLINGVYVPPEARATRPLAEGETLAIWPPIAGG